MTILESATVLEVGEGKVVVQDKDFNRLEFEIDTVVTCHVKPNVDFLEEAAKQGLQMVNIGDSVLPRNLHAAVLDGAVFGKNVDGDALTNPNNAQINDLPIDVLAQLTR